MIVPDTNLLIYAYDSSSRFHTQAKTWFESAMSGTEPIGMPASVIAAFVRLMTHPKVFTNPMSVDTVCSIVDSWLDHPTLTVLGDDTQTMRQCLNLLKQVGVARNLSNDAQIASLVLKQGATLYSNDTDFYRFKGLHPINPLQE